LLQQAATTPAQTPPNARAWRAAVLATVNVLALVLAVRLTLLVAVIGAIVLATIAVRDPDPWRLGALAIYGVLVVCPAMWLASRR